MMANPDVVTFTVEAAIYAVPVSRVQEVLDAQPTAPMPNAPPHLLGMIDLRGTTVPVVDLRRILGRPWADDTPQTRLLIVWIGTGDRRALVGLRSDSVIEVTQLDEGKITPMDAGDFLQWHDRSVMGFGRCEGEVVSVLDLDNLFSPMLTAALAPVLSQTSDQPDHAAHEAAE